MAQVVRKSLQMASIISRVFLHPRGKRPARPIHFLRTFFEFYTQMFFDEMAKTELGVTEEARRGHRIEDGAGSEVESFAEHPEIVIGSVKNDFATLKRPQQFGEIQTGQRIDKKICSQNAELH